MRRVLVGAIIGAAWLGLAGLTGAGEKAATPLRGKDLSGWKFRDAKRSKWQLGSAAVDPSNPGRLTAKEEGHELVNLVAKHGEGTDIYTAETWGDVRVEVELMVPKGSNSGIYLMGEYEVQVLDSHGKKKVGPGDLGGLYGASAPKTNAAKAPGEWQTFIIDFQAPRFDGGKKVGNAKFLKVELNGEVIHENVEMKGVTPTGVTGREAPTGPLMFQGDHGPVAYRNLKITPR